MCVWTGAKKYDHYTPEIRDEHLSTISFTNRTVLMPWALYMIPPGAIRTGKASGELTEDGERHVKKGLVSLFKV